MGNNAHFEYEQSVKHYEAYYETKYKRADILEKSLLTKLFSNFSQVQTVLEIGCGTGHFLRWMELTLGFKCYGVDVSKGMLADAKRRWHKGSLMQGEGAQLPLIDKSFDIVVFMTSLEFMSDATLSIKEAARVAGKGLIFGLMNKNSPSTVRKRLQSKMRQDSFYKEAKFYSISDIKEMLEKVFSKRYVLGFWSTTVFPRGIGSLQSSRLPFGDFLGVTVMLRDL